MGRGLVRGFEFLTRVDRLDPDIAGGYGLTPLALAARHGHLKVAQLLIDEGRADVNRGKPLTLATEHYHHDIFALLLGTGRVDLGIYERSDLEAAVYCGNSRFVELLLNTGRFDPGYQEVKSSSHGERYGCATLLEVAATKGDCQVVDLLLKIGKVDPNVGQWIDEHDNHFPELGYSWAGERPIVLAAEGGYYEVVRLLASTGKIDHSDIQRALELVPENHVKVREELLQYTRPSIDAEWVNT